MKTNHFLITRFNLKVDSWTTTREGKTVLDEKWLSQRFLIFEKYCLPSVMGQTDLNFKWLLFFDTDTPLNFKNKIKGLIQGFSQFEVIYINNSKLLNEAIKKNIEKNLLHNWPEFIITTRLDNDDLLHREFIATIKRLYKPSDNLVIDLRKGYQVSLGKTHEEIRSFNFPFNPFISLVEKSNNIKTVMSKEHRNWKENSNVVIYDKKELWVELIHDSNKVNAIRAHEKRISTFNNEDFILKPGTFTENPVYLFLNNLKLGIRKFSRRIFKKFERINLL